MVNAHTQPGVCDTSGTGKQTQSSPENPQNLADFFLTARPTDFLKNPTPELPKFPRNFKFLLVMKDLEFTTQQLLPRGVGELSLTAPCQSCWI